MKSILLTITSLELGGAERNIVNLSNFLYEKGYNVNLLVIGSSGPLIDELNNNINIKFLDTTWYYSYFKILFEIKKLNPDFCISTMKELNFIVILTKLFHNKKIIVREANTFSSELNYEKKIFKRLINYMCLYVYRFSDSIVVLSEHMKFDFKKLGFKNIDKMTVIPNYVNKERIFELSCEYVNINLKGKIIFGSVGRMYSTKNYEEAIKSIHSLDDNSNVVYLIIGCINNEYKKQLELLAEKLNISKKILFIKQSNNPYKYMNLIDCLILPSKFEGYPNVLLEAIVLNKYSIVSSTAGAAKDIVNKYQCGISYDSSSEQSLRLSIEYFLENKNNLIFDNSKFMYDHSDVVCFNKYEDLFI